MYAQCMKRQRVKFPWDLYWENKTYKLKRSIEPVNTYNVRFFWEGGREGFLGEYLAMGECKYATCSTTDTTLSSHIEIQHIASALVSEYECRKSCLFVHVKV